MKKYYKPEKYIRKLQSLVKNIAAVQRRRRTRRFLQEVFGRTLTTPPLTLVDIGASGGLPEYWQGLGPYLSVIGFEPDKNAYNELAEHGKQTKDQTHRTYIKSALSNEAGEVDFYITRKQRCSSLLFPNRKLLDKFPNPGRFDIVSSTKMKTKTLDATFNEAGIQGVDFIKLDTQGSELAILQGATETLKKELLGVQVEVEFIDMYKGQPLFGEVDSFLRQLGFVLLDFIDISRWERKTMKGRGQIMFTDALYIKQEEHVLRMQGSKAKLLKAVSICVLYERFDYAIALLEEGLKNNIVDAVECQHMTRTIMRL